MVRRILRDGDILAGALLAALGVFVIVEARKWEYMGFDGPGPGFFPLWYGLAMTVLSLWLVLARAWRLRDEREGVVDWARVNWEGVGRALGTWAVFVAAVLLMRPLGFVLSFGLLTLVLVRVQFAQPWRTAMTTAIGLAAGFYVVFPLALDVPLPVGLLGF